MAHGSVTQNASKTKQPDSSKCFSNILCRPENAEFLKEHVSLTDIRKFCDNWCVCIWRFITL